MLSLLRASIRSIYGIPILLSRTRINERSCTLPSRRTESPRAPLGIGQAAFQPFHRLVAGHDHLRNAVARVDGVRLAPQIQQNDPHFAAVSRVLEILKQEHRLLVEGTLDLLRGLGVVPLETGAAEEFHHAERLVFVRLSFLASLWSEAMNSPWLEKGPWTLPASMSARPSASSASTMRRCSGVYSLSAAGSFGWMLITPPDTLNSSSWPLLRPARRRTARGTTSGVLFLTVTVMEVVNLVIV